ncbi:MAG TPA: succinylglutamate desuccinylase/aspartoacylase family protein [Bryobacteraceae bacterium]|nr:succinylglutamate desuccinylase/aspartoacylase family protein [Bryobacteraceae bacterium]
MTPKTQIITEIDFDRPGKQQGTLRIPYSHNLAGWANILIPITVVANGAGPTVLALGGNHGDEYEGPVALMKLARAIQPSDITGRLILIPALNLPAVMAGTRLSPIDGVNLNRAFPGKYNDTVTGLIAHYLTNVLFPLADVVMDLHGGGRSMDFIPCAHLHRVSDDAQFQKMLAAAKCWGQPYVLIYADIAGEGLLPVQAESMGKLVVTTEMGGAGQCSPAVMRITEQGIHNVLSHVGLLAGQPAPAPQQVTVVAATRREDYHLSPAAGIYESFFDLGETIEQGRQIGQVHFPDRFDWAPEPVIASGSGILICRRFPGGTSRGDCVAVIARAVEV